MRILLTQRIAPWLLAFGALGLGAWLMCGCRTAPAVGEEQVIRFTVPELEYEQWTPVFQAPPKP